MNCSLNKYELASYIKELKSLSCTGEVNKNNLSCLDEVEKIRGKTSQLDELPINKAIVEFSVLGSKNFNNFKTQLLQKNSSSVYIWTPRTNSCGLYSVESIDAVNFNFPFNINAEGILVLLSVDGKDKLLLDFYKSDEGKQVVEIEVSGKNWSSAEFSMLNSLNPKPR
jgi:hypothetical protein